MFATNMVKYTLHLPQVLQPKIPSITAEHRLRNSWLNKTFMTSVLCTSWCSWGVWHQEYLFQVGK